MGRAYVTVIVCQAAAAVAAVMALRWVAVHVSPEALGRYVLYQSVVSAGGLFLISWPNAALLRFGREEWSAQGQVGRTLGGRLALFGISVAAALLLVLACDRWLQVFMRQESSPFLWVAAGLIVLPLGELAVYLGQAVGRTSVYGYSPLITRTGFLIGVVAIPMLDGAVDWTYLAGWLVGAAAAAACFTFASLPRSVWSGLAVDATVMSRLVRYSWTLPFAGVSTYVVSWVDSWVIREVRGLGPVGVYSWAYQITAVAGLAFAPLAVVLTPRVIDARLRNDTLTIQRYADAILPAALLLSILVAFALALVRPALSRFASAEYAGAYPVLLILLAMLPVQLITYLVTPIANAFESLLPRVVLASVAIAVINTVGDLLLVPRIGLAGAALATTVAFTIGAMLLIVIIGRVGVAFAPASTYGLPALVLGGPIGVLLWAPEVPVAAVALAALAALAGAALVLARGWGSSPAVWRSPFSGLTALADALTLSAPRLPTDRPCC